MKTVILWSIGIALRLLAALLALLSALALISANNGFKVALWLGMGAAVFYYSSRFFLRSSGDKKMQQTEARPIIYLRSFGSDSGAVLASWWRPIFLLGRFGMTEGDEEALARALGGIGPFIAIGQPNEWLPKLGAYRIYRGDHEWQYTVRDLLKRASLVIVRVGYTPGLLWELKTIAELVDSNRIVFWNPRFGRPDKDVFKKFLEQMSEMFRVESFDNLFRAPFFGLSTDRERQKLIRGKAFLREFVAGFCAGLRAYLGGVKASNLHTRIMPHVTRAGLAAPRLKMRACEPLNAAFFIVTITIFYLSLFYPDGVLALFLKYNGMLETGADHRLHFTCGNKGSDDCLNIRQFVRLVNSEKSRMNMVIVAFGVLFTIIVAFQIIAGGIIKMVTFMFRCARVLVRATL
jgi:hypothetical protein